MHESENRPAEVAAARDTAQVQVKPPETSEPPDTADGDPIVDAASPGTSGAGAGPAGDREAVADVLPAPSDFAPIEGEAEADSQLRAVVEAIVYITEEPLTAEQIATGLNQPPGKVREILAQLMSEYDHPRRGVTLREVAGGFKLTTKAEHHDAIRSFVRSLKPPLKLSMAALETLAVISYKQPITAPEIMEIRGVQGASVLKTLLDRKLITTAGRKQVVGKPILYRTTREFLIQFGLKDLSELPTLKEFEELRRLALTDELELAVGAVPCAGDEAGAAASRAGSEPGPPEGIDSEAEASTAAAASEPRAEPCPGEAHAEARIQSKPAGEAEVVAEETGVAGEPVA